MFVGTGKSTDGFNQIVRLNNGMADTLRRLSSTQTFRAKSTPPINGKLELFIREKVLREFAYTTIPCYIVSVFDIFK